MASAITTANLDALDSPIPVNAKKLTNYFQRPSSTINTSRDVGNASKKRGTLNSSINLQTFIKILDEVTIECTNNNIEIVPDNLVKYVQKHRLAVNKFKEDRDDEQGIVAAAAAVAVAAAAADAVILESTASTFKGKKRKCDDEDMDDEDDVDCGGDDDNVEDDDDNIMDDDSGDEENVDEGEVGEEEKNNTSPTTGGDDDDDNNNNNDDDDDDKQRCGGGGDAKKVKITDVRIDAARLEENYLKVFNSLFVVLEKENISTLFPREQLRFFLSTYTKFVTLDDFKYTNKPCTEQTSKKNKNKNLLHNGSILSEYSKSPANLQNNLSRCDNSDADALRQICNRGIRINGSIYEPLNRPINDQIVYNKTNDVQKDCVLLKFNGTKHYIICFTENILLIWDGVQYVLPSINIEKEFTAGLLYNNSRPREIYILQTIVCGNKLKIVDVIDARNTNGRFQNNMSYMQRREFCHETFKNWELASIVVDPPTNYNNSNVQVPNICTAAADKIGVNRYVFIKPGQIVAAFGLENQNVLIAYKRLDNDDDLEYKISVPFTGPAALFISLQRMRFMTDDEKNEKRVKINIPNCGKQQQQQLIVHDVPDGNDVKILKTYVPVELKDGSKLGSYIIGPIDDLTEYKHQFIQKNNNTAKTHAKILCDPQLLDYFMNDFEKLTNDAIKERYKHIFLKVSERINDVGLKFVK